MRTSRILIIIGVVFILALGANALYRMMSERLPAPPSTTKPGAFGKLPALTPFSQLSGAERSTTGAPSMMPTPAGAGMMDVKTDSVTMPAPDYYPCPVPLGEGTAGASFRYPCEPPQQTTVTYSWNGAVLPEAPAQSVVYQSTNARVSAQSLAFLAGSLGKMFSGADISNFSATDSDGFSWSVDLPSRTFNFWKNIYPVYGWEAISSGGGSTGSSGSATAGVATPPSTVDSIRVKPDYLPPPPAMLSDAELINIARSFFQSRGVSLDTIGAPQVERFDYGGEWYPSQMNVYVPYFIGNTPVVNWDGSPARLIQVSVDLARKEVVGGNGIIDGPYESSTYPSVKSADALAQALTGGMNPYGGYWYGYDMMAKPMMTDPSVGGTSIPLPKLPQSINVGWEKASLAYLWFPSYQVATTRIYLVPVYLFSGNVALPDGTKQPWSSWVPAIPQQYFDSSPIAPPVPLPAVLEGAVPL